MMDDEMNDENKETSDDDDNVNNNINDDDDNVNDENKNNNDAANTNENDNRINETQTDKENEIKEAQNNTPTKKNSNETIQQNNDNDTTTQNNQQNHWRKRKKSSTIRDLAKQLRINASTAPPPPFLSSSSSPMMIAYDVHLPNSNFRKSNPGPPDFYVAITSFHTSSPPFAILQLLLKKHCNEEQEIGLRIATVAEDGCVVMFGLTDYGVPSIC